MSIMQNWYVLHTKPHKERQLASLLHQQKVEAYLPQVRVWPANPRAARIRPYFPSYLFARMESGVVGSSRIQWMPGLQRVVEFGGQPAIVPDHFIQALKKRLDEIQAAGGLVLAQLEHGDPVKVVHGPFAGYGAIFDTRLGGADRVRIFLRLVEESQRFQVQSRYLPLELSAGSIEKARPQPA
jgi:transcription elongation factor/antiterminator RfaH